MWPVRSTTSWRLAGIPRPRRWSRCRPSALRTGTSPSPRADGGRACRDGASTRPPHGRERGRGADGSRLPAPRIVDASWRRSDAGRCAVAPAAERRGPWREPQAVAMHGRRVPAGRRDAACPGNTMRSSRRPCMLLPGCRSIAEPPPVRPCGRGSRCPTGTAARQQLLHSATGQAVGRWIARCCSEVDGRVARRGGNRFTMVMAPVAPRRWFCTAHGPAPALAGRRHHGRGQCAPSSGSAWPSIRSRACTASGCACARWSPITPLSAATSASRRADAAWSAIAAQRGEHATTRCRPGSRPSARPGRQARDAARGGGAVASSASRAGRGCGMHPSARRCRGDALHQQARHRAGHRHGDARQRSAHPPAGLAVFILHPSAGNGVNVPVARRGLRSVIGVRRLALNRSSWRVRQVPSDETERPTPASRKRVVAGRSKRSRRAQAVSASACSDAAARRRQAAVSTRKSPSSASAPPCARPDPGAARVRAGSGPRPARQRGYAVELGPRRSCSKGPPRRPAGWGAGCTARSSMPRDSSCRGPPQRPKRRSSSLAECAKICTGGEPSREFRLHHLPRPAACPPRAVPGTHRPWRFQHELAVRCSRRWRSSQELVGAMPADAVS